MKTCYPVILTKCEDGSGYLVTIPDFGNNTFGATIPEAMDMARDAVNLLGVTYEDKKWDMPAPSNLADVVCGDNDMKILVDVDFAAYRRMLDNRSVKKNCTIPSWLNEMAEQANINFSAVLQEALKQRLQIN